MFSVSVEFSPRPAPSCTLTPTARSRSLLGRTRTTTRMDDAPAALDAAPACLAAMSPSAPRSPVAPPRPNSRTGLILDAVLSAFPVFCVDLGSREGEKGENRVRFGLVISAWFSFRSSVSRCVLLAGVFFLLEPSLPKTFPSRDWCCFRPELSPRPNAGMMKTGSLVSCWNRERLWRPTHHALLLAPLRTCRVRVFVLVLIQWLIRRARFVLAVLRSVQPVDPDEEELEPPFLSSFFPSSLLPGYLTHK